MTFAKGAGSATGGLLGAARTHGRRRPDRARGLTELHCDDATLGLLYVRQIMLVNALLSRGHAAMTATAMPHPDTGQMHRLLRQLPEPLRRARVHGSWSAIAAVDGGSPPTDLARQEAIAELAVLIDEALAPTGSQPRGL